MVRIEIVDIQNGINTVWVNADHGLTPSISPRQSHDKVTKLFCIFGIFTSVIVLEQALIN